MNFRQKLFQAKSYAWHWLYKVNAHSLHHPALYNFYSSVIAGPTKAKPKIETQRAKLLRSTDTVNFTELGAGSSVEIGKVRAIKSIARHSTTPLKFSLFLQNLINYYGLINLVELGTSLGINTAYMATAHSNCQVLTFEGCAPVAQIAQNTFTQLNLENIEVVVGNLESTLAPSLQKMPLSSVDLVYLDANHRYEPTLRYIKQLKPYLAKSAILVVDDIHWSTEMNRAWQQLLADDHFSLKLDLYEAGLLFLDKSLPKESWVIDY